MFQKVLIANRGEIAVRIAQTLQEMGVEVVAVYSDSDRSAPHVLHADHVHPLHGNTSAETYLDIHKIIDIGRASGADAIHPGYGFLSENAAFAQACADAGIKFIGPSAKVIESMGDKITAKRLLSDAGVPVVPGWSGDVTGESAEVIEQAGRIGYPILVKAAAGGGGKGMRVVGNQAELHTAVEAARREAKAAFGDARVFIEKYIETARHVEVQLLCDEHGNALHLFERDCSVQRRHQKVVEEAPAPGLSAVLRAAIGDAAVRAAKAIGYTNAGTIEFLLAPDDSFYFLEVNTRLQVEHPVTELITGLDLVRCQTEIAAGQPLPFAQEDLRINGHAVECRVYAEDAWHGFLPSTGCIEAYNEPRGVGIRVDSGVMQGTHIGVFYDPMLAKLIAWAPSREHAMERMSRALRQFVVLGVKTNIEYLRRIVDHPAFRAAQLSTRFLETETIAHENEDVPPEAWIAAALAGKTGTSVGVHHADGQSQPVSRGPWASATAWRGV